MGRAAAHKRTREALKALRRLARVFAGAIPMEQCLRGSIYWLGGRQSRARDSWNHAIEAAERLGSRLHLALIHQEVGRLTQERPHLEEGLRLFEEIGATLQVSRTLRYLGKTVAEENHETAAQFFERALTLHDHMNAEHEFSLVQAEHRKVCIDRPGF